MRFTLFYHSLLSDWNHGNAHFLRGIVTDLQKRGHKVDVCEPKEGWSLQNLLIDGGQKALDDIQNQFPDLKTNFYDPQNPELEEKVKGADVVLVHEWNEPSLVKEVGKLKETYGYTLIFHDTHHRSVSQPQDMARYDLKDYDGVLAFGDMIRQVYLNEGWTQRAWTWHEAADTTVFYPRTAEEKEGDLIWIGNWGDEERSEELMEYLIAPVKELRLKAAVYGVRYPEEAQEKLKAAGIGYKGWLPNHKAAEVFSRYRFTVHVPRRYYTQKLPGIPTIRPFEAMACGIPLISAPWQDSENLFRVGEDFLMVHSGEEMKAAIKEVLQNEQLAESLRLSGLEIIRKRHTCAHRVDELLQILEEVASEKAEAKIYRS